MSKRRRVSSARDKRASIRKVNALLWRDATASRSSSRKRGKLLLLTRRVHGGGRLRRMYEWFGRTRKRYITISAIPRLIYAQISTINDGMITLSSRMPHNIGSHEIKKLLSSLYDNLSRRYTTIVKKNNNKIPKNVLQKIENAHLKLLFYIRIFFLEEKLNHGDIGHGIIMKVIISQSNVYKSQLTKYYNTADHRKEEEEEEEEEGDVVYDTFNQTEANLVAYYISRNIDFSIFSNNCIEFISSNIKEKMDFHIAEIDGYLYSMSELFDNPNQVSQESFLQNIVSIHDQYLKTITVSRDNFIELPLLIMVPVEEVVIKIVDCIHLLHEIYYNNGYNIVMKEDIKLREDEKRQDTMKEDVEEEVNESQKRLKNIMNVRMFVRYNIIDRSDMYMELLRVRLKERKNTSMSEPLQEVQSLISNRKIYRDKTYHEMQNLKKKKDGYAERGKRNLDLMEQEMMMSSYQYY